MPMQSAGRYQRVMASTLVLLLLVAGLASAASFEDAKAAGRTGAGARVRIVAPADVAAPLVERILAVAPGADVRAIHGAPTAVAVAEARADAPHVLLVAPASARVPTDGTSALTVALATAARDGVLVVVPAGDDALHHWAGAWRDADGDGWLDAAEHAGGLAVTLRAGETLRVALTWDSIADLDLFLYSHDRKVPLAWSADYQPHFSGPIEELSYTASSDRVVRVVVRAHTINDTPRMHLRLDPLGPRFDAGAIAAGSLRAPADARGVLVVTTDSHSAGQGPADVGPVDLVRIAGAGSTLAASADVAALLALLRGAQPAATPAALREAVGSTLDIAAAFRHISPEPARLAPVSDAPGVIAPGPVDIQLAFTDVVRDGRVVLVRPDGGSLDVIGAATGSSWNGRIEVPGVDGRWRIAVDGFVDWLDRSVPADATDVFTVDATPPRAVWGAFPSWATKAFNVSWQAEDAHLAGVDLLVRHDDGAWAPWLLGAAAVGEAAFADLVDGERITFRLTARDAVGHATTLDSTVVTVDTTPPTLAWVGDHLDARDEGAGLDETRILITVDDAMVPWTWGALGRIIPHIEPLAPGEHVVRAQVTDLAGWVTVSTRVVVVPQPPVSAPSVAASSASSMVTADPGWRLPIPPPALWFASVPAPLVSSSTDDLRSRDPNAPAPASDVAGAPVVDVPRGSVADDGGIEALALTPQDAEVAGTASVPRPSGSWLPPAMMALVGLLLVGVVATLHPRTRNHVPTLFIDAVEGVVHAGARVRHAVLGIRGPTKQFVLRALLLRVHLRRALQAFAVRVSARWMAFRAR